MKSNYNMKSIMLSAWRFVKAGRAANIGEGLRKAWANAKAVATATANASGEVHTWSGWRDLEREVVHGSACLFKVKVLDPYTKNGTRVLAFFGEEQTCPLGSQD